jgi:hypothetical protein
MFRLAGVTRRENFLAFDVTKGLIEFTYHSHEKIRLSPISDGMSRAESGNLEKRSKSTGN